MRTQEFLNEAISSKVFHYTSLRNALDIIISGEFKLSAVVGSIENQHMPKGYTYFLSTTRTLTGGYHSVFGSSAVMFNLDGGYYNNITKGGPVDYWQDRGYGTNYAGRPSEAEDRIFGKTNTLPIDGLTSIHIYVEPMSKKERDDFGTYLPGLARKLLLAAKIRRIPAYLYENKIAWRRQDPNGQVDIQPRETLRGPEQPGYNRPSRQWLLPWLELMYATNKQHLGKKAIGILGSIDRIYYRTDVVKGLATELSNARKPSATGDYPNVIKIVQFMKQNKLKTLDEFVDFLSNRWNKLKPPT